MPTEITPLMGLLGLAGALLGFRMGITGNGDFLQKLGGAFFCTIGGFIIGLIGGWAIPLALHAIAPG